MFESPSLCIERGRTWSVQIMLVRAEQRHQSGSELKMGCPLCPVPSTGFQAELTAVETWSFSQHSGGDKDKGRCRKCDFVGGPSQNSLWVTWCGVQATPASFHCWSQYFVPSTLPSEWDRIAQSLSEATARTDTVLVPSTIAIPCLFRRFPIPTYTGEAATEDRIRLTHPFFLHLPTMSMVYVRLQFPFL